MKYFHVDVFSDKPLSGNGLTVVFPDKPLSNDDLLKITQELRQFETIFIYDKTADGSYPVRIFTMDEELAFAGHPTLGAAAVLHRLDFPAAKNAEMILDLSGRNILVSSEFNGSSCSVTMNQGTPAFISHVDKNHHAQIAGALGLDPADIHDTLPVEVVSTGLHYLLVPVKQGLDRAKISIGGFESFLGQFGAKFVYVFDAASLECRTWNNSGLAEDVATGSAAGPLCAYLIKHGLARTGETVNIRQGRFVHRPSVIRAWANPTSGEIFINGSVSFFASGNIHLP